MARLFPKVSRFSVDFAAPILAGMEDEARDLRRLYVLARGGIGLANKARTREARSAAFTAYNGAVRMLNEIERRIAALLTQVGPIQMALWGF